MSAHVVEYATPQRLPTHPAITDRLTARLKNRTGNEMDALGGDRLTYLMIDGADSRSMET